MTVPSKQVVKILDIDGLTRPNTKAAIDPLLAKGWRIVTVYNEAAQTRVMLVREKEA